MIRKKLGGMDQVQALEFNLMQRVLTVVHRAGQLPAVQAAIRELGMEAENIDNAGTENSDEAPPAKTWLWSGVQN